MARTKTPSRDAYVCSECGWTTAKWVGRCGECQQWGSVVEQGTRTNSLHRTTTAVAPSQHAVPISQVRGEAAHRTVTGVGELDRVLGGGIVPGAVVLLAGEPGVGKSTLLLEVAAAWARRGRRTLYVTGEESAAQVRMRAERTADLSDELYLAAETDLGTVLGHVEQVSPTLLVVDSVQTMQADTADGTAGGVTQVREVTSTLVRAAKQRHMAVVIVGHVTKDGSIAGPRSLEHLVDVVLSFEGDRHSGFRMVRATKNRFGPADEVGCFEMRENGIVEVADPSGLFISTGGAGQPVPGTCITVTVEGRRPLLAEIQSLVANSPLQVPRRTNQGVDGSRVAMLTAVLERRARQPLGNKDVYVSTVGGARVFDPAADLAIALAIASGTRDIGLPPALMALGEIGLAGELRRVPGVARRVSEAVRLGFRTILVPASSEGDLDRMPGTVRVLAVESVGDALGLFGLMGGNGRA
ncbi:DNA repair protein RadA/Sms [Raineyella antarctica]|uniref:DNA repair protein RadA n=1 Tax=Raineyella antarctica TaxID=1577474 RepID=A0A1G6GE15_9ACTN|nr:DNA repair protein RadA [Raineyella antarctica]SDB80220.1 DNA repair protein RadA/Sms [Raineyella antarctica]